MKSIRGVAERCAPDAQSTGRVDSPECLVSGAVVVVLNHRGDFRSAGGADDKAHVYLPPICKGGQFKAPHKAPPG